MLRVVTAMKARQNLGELLEEDFHKQNSFVIKRGRKPMAVVLPLTEYEAYRRQRDEDFRVFDEIRSTPLPPSAQISTCPQPSIEKHFYQRRGFRSPSIPKSESPPLTPRQILQ